MNIRTSVALLIGSLLLSQPGWAEIGRVKRSDGNCTIERGATKLPLTPGVQLQPGDVLVTGKDGSLGVTFIDDTRFALGPDSRVAVASFDYDRATEVGSFLAQISRGTLLVAPGEIAKSGRDAMKVRTPTSLLGVRGRRFIVEVH